ncbi:MAG: DUF2490 domain-containing protein [Bacteroidales bacterium]|nr:DUF2490 domain-containing protein [Bacteroidales bacterium]
MKERRQRSVYRSLEGQKWGVALLVLLSLRLLWAVPAFSQSVRSTDVGAILGAKYEGTLAGDLALQVEEELRFEGWNGHHLDRWLNELTVEYPFLHRRMHVGISGGAIRRYNDRGYYENRARLGLDVSYAETFRRFKFSYRSRLMATFRDEAVADYRVNPKLYWRHRLQATYQMPGSRFKYALSTELHWLVNDPKASVVDNLRTVFTVNYRLTRRQSLSAFLRLDNDLQVKHPMDRIYVGLTYHYKS